MDNIKKKKTKKKIKKLPKISNEIIPIKNLDKTHTEKWTDSRAKNDISNMPNPSRILLLGPPSVGKSTLIKNLIIHQNPPFDEVYLVHEDAEYTNEWLDLDPTECFSEIPDLDFWERDDTKFKKRAIILDDLEYVSANKQRLKNLAILFRYASSHKKVTVYLAHQSFFDTPILVKKMSNVYILWKPRSRNELTLVENRTGLKKDTLKTLFKTVATKFRDSIMIDLTENSPCKLRLNVWKKLKEVQSSGDEDEDESDDDD